MQRLNKLLLLSSALLWQDANAYMSQHSKHIDINEINKFDNQYKGLTPEEIQRIKVKQEYEAFEAGREADQKKIESLGQEWEVHQRYKKDKEKDEMIHLLWMSVDYMVILSLFLFIAYKIYKKCQEHYDPSLSNKIPTRRDIVIAENSAVLDGNDLENLKIEYIKRKRGLKYPPTCNDISADINTTANTNSPHDQSLTPPEEMMSCSDSSQNRSDDFVARNNGSKKQTKKYIELQ